MTERPPQDAREHGPGRHVHREAARLVLVDETDEHVLLVRGFDPAAPGVVYWFTIGGGVHAGEDPRRAAAREAFEEAGVVVDPDALVGPFQRESVVFGFDGVTVHQEQEFYLARVQRVEPVTTGLDELEMRSTVSVSWVRLEDLAVIGETETVYPTNVSELVAELRVVQPPRPRV